MSLKLRTDRNKKICIKYHSIPDNPNSGLLAKFWVIPLTPSETDKLLEQYRVNSWDAPDKRTKKERFTELDLTGLAHAKVKRVIVDWEDVADEKGNPLPCTDENKILVYELNPEVINWVLDRSDEIAGLEEDRKRELEKNLQSSQDGEQSIPSPASNAQK